MGQYYHVAINRNNDIHTITVKNGGWRGLKIMEHAYFNEPYLKAVTLNLLKSPARVVWCGDYTDYALGTASANNDYSFLYGEENAERRALVEKAYKAIWQDANAGEHVYEIDAINEAYDETHNYILLNHTKREYIDLAKHFALFKDIYGHCVHPLPLLTDCSNQDAGGDYHGSCKEKMRWVGDLIEIQPLTEASLDAVSGRYTEIIAPFLGYNGKPYACIGDRNLADAHKA